ncbi:hypothetical protein CEE37_02540 [candidate division LCP-89 bacterium B3_LCP]|uniref:Secretion system C-terminal sorting domain-containing protein n=1 Tax=candidate division LCP-89 bacterium B3_LCP TaxID=2012998 RepID=A0A532V2S8_UNCL8|nr:MAG: hypothetical protein CEE37_02540 [candidate division LCP-89 bacterium B3_LCP]
MGVLSVYGTLISDCTYVEANINVSNGVNVEAWYVNGGAGGGGEGGPGVQDTLECVGVMLTPYNPPILIPASGGSFDYNIGVGNGSPTTENFDFWCDVTLPNGSIYGPVLGPFNLTFLADMYADRDRSQNVPAHAPAGEYSFNAYVGFYPDSATFGHSFPFEKLSDGSLAVGDWTEGWTNSGEPFDEWLTQAAVVLPEEYSFSQVYPNPFNPLARLSFSLPEVSHVKLAIYDLQGRLVANLVDGMSEVGAHEFTFDATNLSSGIYIARLEAGSYSASQKLVLMK